MDMMVRNPGDEIYPATPDYVHAMEVRGVDRLLFVSGTMGLDADGKAPASIDGQLTMVWANIRRILTAWRELEVGGLIVNGSSNFRLDHVPFGGVKDSGFGRESPRCMVEDYTVVKTLMLREMSIWGEN